MSKSGGYTFILEMLLVTLFFSLAAAVLLQVFVAARLKSDENVAKNKALIAAQSALEIALVQEIQPQTEYWYDAGWQPLENSEHASYRVTVSCELEQTSGAGNLYLLSVTTDDLEKDRQLLPVLSTRRIEREVDGE